MDIFKIVGIAIVGCVCTLLLKNTQSQYAMLSSLATGIIILIIALSQSVCEDLECVSIGKKVSFAGKIAIFLLALPIIENLINTVTEIL